MSSKEAPFGKGVINISLTPLTISGGEVQPSEKTINWEGYQDDVLPDKVHGRFLRNLQFQIFSFYRRFFGIVFVVNMAIFIAFCVHGGSETSAKKLGEIVVANLFVAILMRQDHVINAFFTVFCAPGNTWPLWIRRALARVYSIGGLHSGCAVSGTIWLVLFTVQATREVVNKQQTSVATLAVTYVILVLLVGMLIFAYPALRRKLHDTFEVTHRFAGWTAVGLVWAQVILLINDYREPGQSLRQAMVKSAPFWLVVVFTGSIMSSWLRLRKVPVHAEVLSDHAVRFYFDYVNTQPGHFTRMSSNPLLEWHSFATIAIPGRTGYSAIISKAGDWTSRQITDPPKEIWIRGVPCFGVVRVCTLFRRVLLVATGSGIAPLAPVIFAKKVAIQLLWTAPVVRKTFGDKLVDSLLEAAPSAVIYDTRVHGKPDMVKLTYRMVREFNAEAVVVISNPPLTEKVVYGMISRGIPAYGAIWDS
ncbi:hypothetical protein BKA93DRAFT_733116 [Sparassis latifolia]